MNKRIAALLTVFVLLTGCSSNNTHNTKITSQNNKITSQNQQKVEEQSKTETEKNKETSKSEQDTDKTQKLNEIKDAERFNIEEIFNDELGTTYMITGPLGYKKVEKLVNVYRPYQSRYTYYKFAGLDYSRMKEGQPESYSYEFALSYDGEVIGKSGSQNPIIKKDAAEKGESWTGNFTSHQAGEFQAEFQVADWNERYLVVEIKSLPDNGAKVPKGYMERYTFEKGKGLVSIYITTENEDEKDYNLTIALNEMDSSMRLEHQAGIWSDVDRKFIKEIEGLKGYFYIENQY